MIVCPVCGTENEIGTLNCILCGDILDSPNPDEDLSSTGHPIVSEAAQAIPVPMASRPLAPPTEVPPTMAPPTLTPPQSSPLQTTSSPIPQSPTVPGHLQPPRSPSEVMFPHTRGPESSLLHPPGQQIASGPQAMPAPAVTSQAPQSSEVPPAGTLCLIVYYQRKPALYFPVVYDEVLLGRNDPSSNAYPDLDLTPFDPELAISRKHAYLYREQNNFYIYPISNSGTQVNQEMVDLGVKRKLKENDVVILSGRLAIRFARTT